MHPTGPDLGPPNTTEKAMTRLSRSRVAVTTSLALGTSVLGMALAPAAFAADLGPVEGPATAVVGESITLTGTGCDAALEDEPATVYVDFYTAADYADPEGLPTFFVDSEPVDGAWTAEAVVPSDTTPGAYVADVTCEPYAGASVLFYDEFYVTFEAAAVTATPTTPPASTAAPTGAIRGASANTPGITSSTKGSTAAVATAAPGTQITKILKGFKPGEKVTVVLHSTPTVLGTFTADANGVVTATFTVPAGTPVGSHTLVFEGNQGSYFQEAFTVTAVTTASSSGLAYTGADVAVPLALGAGLLALGGGALVVSRRRTGVTQA
jgi:hypothetical protein